MTRYRDTDGDDVYDEQLYALADANWNIMALVDVSSGDIVERFVFDPYGSSLIGQRNNRRPPVNGRRRMRLLRRRLFFAPFFVAFLDEGC
jgi:hypothetical protein